MKKEQLKKISTKQDHHKQFKLQEKKDNKKRYSELFGMVVIILLGIIVYSNSFHCSFQFDDYHFIVNNTGIKNLSDVKAWWNYAPARPIGYFTFALNYHFNRLDIWYWHLVNLVIHLINGCLVWWLTLLIFTSPVMRDLPISKQKYILAFVIGLLFVSHPLATESVTYIYQRLASLVAMFYLLSVALYMKARLTEKGSLYSYFLFAGSFFSAVSAMLTKENAFTLPFMILVCELSFLQTRRLSIKFRDYRMMILMAALLSIVLIIPLKVSSRIFNTIPPLVGHNYTITSLNYFLTEFNVIIKYIQLLFLPINQRLDYDFPISNNFFGIRTFPSFLILLSLIIMAIFFFKRFRIISFGIIWFLLTLSIESSFIPINDVIFEHRTYLPSFGFFLILSSGLYMLFWKRYKYLAILLLVIIIGSNSFFTYERNKVWKDDLTLWSDVVSKSPEKDRPHAYRGVAYASRGKFDMAIDDFSKAINLDPKYKTAYFNRGMTYDNIGQWNKAIDDYSKVIELDPEFTDAYSNRGNIYAGLGNLNKAIADFTRAIEIDPKDLIAYFNRGNSYYNLGQWNKAIDDYTKAIGIDPNFSKAYSNRNNAYKKLRSEKKIR